MGAFAVPFASESFIESSWVFVFAIPPVLVAAFFGGYRRRTRRSLVRIAIAEAVTLTVVGGFMLLQVYAGRGALMAPPFIILGTLGWPAAFVGAAVRVARDASRTTVVQ
jgi:hypothetical protein